MMATCPPRLTSAVVTANGMIGISSRIGAAKPPLPFPRSTEMALSLACVNTRSGTPSSLKSAFSIMKAVSAGPAGDEVGPEKHTDVQAATVTVVAVAVAELFVLTGSASVEATVARLICAPATAGLKGLLAFRKARLA